LLQLQSAMTFIKGLSKARADGTILRASRKSESPARESIQPDTVRDLAIIQGTMFTSSFPIHVLIDSGASHSFISHALAKVLARGRI